MAHVLRQFDRGLFSGAKKNVSNSHRNWRNHLLGARGEDGPNTTVNNISRLEFQDGKRKQGTQRYHGRGTVHSHSLDFLENEEHIHLEEKMSATLPAAESHAFLRGLVLDSQPDRKDSGAPNPM